MAGLPLDLDLPQADWETFIFQALADDDFLVRAEVVSLCIRLADSAGVLAALDRALRDQESLGRRSGAIAALGRLGSKAVPLLSAAAREDKEGLRRLAIEALGMVRATETIPLLLEALEDVSVNVRAAAVEALGRFEDARIGPALVRVAQRRDEAASVHLASLVALAELNETIAPDRLVEFAQSPVTALPALAQLGRQSETTILQGLMPEMRGEAQRGGLRALARALLDRWQEGAPTPALDREEIESHLAGLLGSRNTEDVRAGLVLGALLGNKEVLLQVSRRDNRIAFDETALMAVEILAGTDAGLLGTLRQWVSDAEGAGQEEFLESLLSKINPINAPTRTAPADPSVGAFDGAFDGPSGDLVPAGINHLPLDDATFDALRGLLSRRAGLDIKAHARFRLQMRLSPRIRATRHENFHDYVRFLAEDTPGSQVELSEVLDLATTHETYFFREPRQIDVLASEVLPKRIKSARRRAGPHESILVRIWSAGCSTGEEAWTLAMALEDSGHFSEQVRYEIVATDISEACIAHARRGIFGRRSFRQPDQLERARPHLEKEGPDWRVIDALRGRVRFSVGNLTDADEPGLGSFDVVFCRNVIIYLSNAARTQVLQTFFDVLRPGGILFLGHSESLFNIQTPFAFLPLSGDLVYQRPLSDHRPPARLVTGHSGIAGWRFGEDP
jgi:chemotaxis protein methyltransferase CheR